MQENELNLDKLFELFDALIEQDEEASALRKEINDNLKSCAENIDMEPRDLKELYGVYKKCVSGKVFKKDSDNFAYIMDEIRNRFSE